MWGEIEVDRALWLPAMICTASGDVLPPCCDAPGPEEPFLAANLHSRKPQVWNPRVHSDYAF